ncbi:MAG: NUDIX hydrolase [Candidatus Aminicenantales bacterium]
MPPEPEDFLASVEKGLWAPLPGIAAQLTMAPEPRTGHKAYFEVEDSCRKAGVLVLLSIKDGRLSVLLTRRTERVLHHRGQISFPGGEQHSGESLEATALRETIEEMGLDLTAVRVLGRLTPLFIPPSNYCIYPTVAFIPSPLVFHVQPEEVEEVIEVPVDHLADPANVRRETWHYGGRDIEVPFYAFEAHKIWGATAMVLAELLALFR